jgi:hypothetical protein
MIHLTIMDLGEIVPMNEIETVPTRYSPEGCMGPIRTPVRNVAFDVYVKPCVGPSPCCEKTLGDEELCSLSTLEDSSKDLN